MSKENQYIYVCRRVCIYAYVCEHTQRRARTLMYFHIYIFLKTGFWVDFWLGNLFGTWWVSGYTPKRVPDISSKRTRQEQSFANGAAHRWASLKDYLCLMHQPYLLQPNNVTDIKYFRSSRTVRIYQARRLLRSLLIFRLSRNMYSDRNAPQFHSSYRWALSRVLRCSSRGAIASNGSL